VSTIALAFLAITSAYGSGSGLYRLRKSIDNRKRAKAYPHQVALVVRTTNQATADHLTETLTLVGLMLTEVATGGAQYAVTN
jgi:hypothetical protein